MDGTGQLLRTQTVGLEAAFDVRCLMIPPDDLTSWDVLAEQTIKLIQAELEKNPQRSVYLCGESFGGCLAMKVAVSAPKLFKRIILVNPASSFRLRPWLLWASQFAALVPEFIARFGSLGLIPFLATIGLMSDSDRRDLLKTVRSVPPETILWRLSLIRDFHIDETQLRRLTQPVLLIASAMDRVLPSTDELQRLARIFPQTQQVVLPYSGHACLLEKDINLYKILKSQHFLEQNAPNSESKSLIEKM
jgi:pimeloyl-ACP methyl ester carboxylesterase